MVRPLPAVSLLTNELEAFVFQGTTSAVMVATSTASGQAAQPIATAVCNTLCTVVVEADAVNLACPSHWIHADTALALEAGGADFTCATSLAFFDNGVATYAVDAHVWRLAGVARGTSPAVRDEGPLADAVDALEAWCTGVPDREVARITQPDAGAPLDGSLADPVDAVQALGAEVELAAHAVLGDVSEDASAVDAFQACQANRPDEDVVAAWSALARGHLRFSLFYLLLANPVHARAFSVAIGVLVAAGPAIGALHALIFFFILLCVIGW